MKKILITMAVLTGMVAGAMVFSSFAAPKQNEFMEIAQLNKNVPTYWEGYAYDKYGNNKIYIKVYQVEGQCNAFKAADNYNNEYWVKENSKYDSDNPYGEKSKYYVTINNINRYFNM